MTENTKDFISSRIEHLVREDQDPGAVSRIHERVSAILTSDESIEYVCVQKRPVVNPFPDAIVLTSRRFIHYRPRGLGRVQFDDFVWRELQDVHLHERVMGATINWTTHSGAAGELGFLPKRQARRVYALAQEYEERVQEERRQRSLEDKRAAAGGIVMHQPRGGASDPGHETAPDPVERLKKLGEMADAGLISPGEFEAKRAEIIGGM